MPLFASIEFIKYKKYGVVDNYFINCLYPKYLLISSNRCHARFLIRIVESLRRFEYTSKNKFINFTKGNNKLIANDSITSMLCQNCASPQPQFLPFSIYESRSSLYRSYTDG
jgi:hypothetical protein